jgi:2,4-dienoyl-CoA reductase-like NADH-dependent reductase (Old Yellow Enzyme family)
VGEYRHIFTPIKIGRLTVKNRIEKAPEVYVVGDSSNEMGNLYSATSEGFFAAMEI